MENMHFTYEQLEQRFKFRTSDSYSGLEGHQAVSDVLLNAADQIVQVTGPPTREQALVITKLEEAMFWANAAIARLNNQTT